MTDKDIHDLIIIGGGPGGLSAGVYAMRAAMKTVLIEFDEEECSHLVRISYNLLLS